jgi:VIT1/CCC1 family predicted Fe2+/Mn2+ transporter
MENQNKVGLLSRFVTALSNPGTARGLIALFFVMIFGVIVGTLIYNPLALNTDKNTIIGIVIGAVVVRIGDIFSYYFNQKNGLDGNQNS